MSRPAASPMPTPDLGGILTRRPKSAATGSATPQPVADLDTGGPQTAAEPTAPQPAAQRTSRKPATPATAVVSEPAGNRTYLRSLTVYLPRSVHQQVHRAADDQNTTATALILLAINRNHQGLAGPLADELELVHAGSGDLFAIPQVKKTAEPTVQTTIRVTDAQRDALTQLVTELKTTVGARVNRSLVVTAALRLDLA